MSPRFPGRGNGADLNAVTEPDDCARDVKRGSKNRNSFQNRVLEIDFPKL